MTTEKQSALRRTSDWINVRHHRAVLNVFMVVTFGHWSEHIVQAYQIWVLKWPRPQARGLLGEPFPWLVTSEVLHYGYALVMLIFLFLLRPGFVGRARIWWTVALIIQFWHHFEHLLLLIQAQDHHNFWGKPVPTSILQLIYPRVEPHLFYNSIVFIPMMIGVYFHLRPDRADIERMDCSCVAPAPQPIAAPAAAR